jgi:hypothetical protein
VCTYSSSSSLTACCFAASIFEYLQHGRLARQVHHASKKIKMGCHLPIEPLFAHAAEFAHELTWVCKYEYASLRLHLGGAYATAFGHFNTAVVYARIAPMGFVSTQRKVARANVRLVRVVAGGMGGCSRGMSDAK